MSDLTEQIERLEAELVRNRERDHEILAEISRLSEIRAKERIQPEFEPTVQRVKELFGSQGKFLDVNGCKYSTRYLIEDFESVWEFGDWRVEREQYEISDDEFEVILVASNADQKKFFEISGSQSSYGDPPVDVWYVKEVFPTEKFIKVYE